MFHRKGKAMQLYDSLARTPEEIDAALSKDGAILALDVSQFVVVATPSGIMLQLRSLDPGLPIAIPTNALRIMLPHEDRFTPPPPEAVRFAVSDHVRVRGTSC